MEEQNLLIHKIQAHSNDLLEVLVYGIYLVQQKKNRGRCIDDTLDRTTAEIESTLRSFFKRPLIVFNMTALFFLTLASKVLLFWTESILLSLDPRAGLGSKQFVSCFAVLSSAIAVNFLKNIACRYMADKVFLSMNKSLLDSVLSSDIRSIINKKSHSVLDNTNKHLVEAEMRIPITFAQLSDNLSTVLLCAAIMLYCQSILSAVVLVVSGVILGFLARIALPVYINIDYFNHQVESKIDDMNYQLLGLISGYRISGRLGQIFLFC